MKAYFGLFVLLCCAFACGRPATSERPVPKDTAPGTSFKLTKVQRLLLDSLDITLDPVKLKFALDTAFISFAQVHAYSKNQKDIARKGALVEAVCLGVPNYLGEQNPDYWGGILYDKPRFMKLLAQTKEPGQQLFMDIGSGNGEKLYAALCSGFSKAYGLEYEARLVHISKQWLRPFAEKGMLDITLGDALEIDGSFYGQPDFLYMYSPIKDQEAMAKLYFRIMQHMKVGACLMEVRMVYMEDLRRLTHWPWPNRKGVFVLKRTEDGYYFLEQDQPAKVWKKLLTD